MAQSQKYSIKEFCCWRTFEGPFHGDHHFSWYLINKITLWKHLIWCGCHQKVYSKILYVTFMHSYVILPLHYSLEANIKLFTPLDLFNNFSYSFIYIYIYLSAIWLKHKQTIKQKTHSCNQSTSNVQTQGKYGVLLKLIANLHPWSGFSIKVEPNGGSVIPEFYILRQPVISSKPLSVLGFSLMRILNVSFKIKVSVFI